MCRANAKEAHANSLLPSKEKVSDAHRPTIGQNYVTSYLPAVRDVGNQPLLVKHCKIKIKLCNVEVKHILGSLNMAWFSNPAHLFTHCVAELSCPL